MIDDSDKPISKFLAADHRRLEGLLDRAAAAPTIDRSAYAEFREGLLRHIAMEEKVLLPLAKRKRDGVPIPQAARLKADHAAIAALLVPPPTPELVATLRGVLEEHDALEEGGDGVYAVCEELAAEEAAAVAAQLLAVTRVPAAPHVDEPRVHAHIADLLARRKTVSY